MLLTEVSSAIQCDVFSPLPRLGNGLVVVVDGKAVYIGGDTRFIIEGKGNL